MKGFDFVVRTVFPLCSQFRRALVCVVFSRLSQSSVYAVISFSLGAFWLSFCVRCPRLMFCLFLLFVIHKIDNNDKILCISETVCSADIVQYIGTCIRR